MPPTAIHAGPQHVCLKRAFAILENRWKMEATEGSDFLATSGQGHLSFGKSSLSPDLVVSVMDFLGPHLAMRSGRICKDWWRNGVLSSDGTGRGVRHFYLSGNCGVLTRFSQRSMS